MKTLEQLTDAIKAAGAVKPRMERNYKRKDHRETLVRAWIPTSKGTSRKAQAEALFKRLRAEGFDLTYTSWDYATGEPTAIWVQARVELADFY